MTKDEADKLEALLHRIHLVIYDQAGIRTLEDVAVGIEELIEKQYVGHGRHDALDREQLWRRR